MTSLDSSLRNNTNEMLIARVFWDGDTDAEFITSVVVEAAQRALGSSAPRQVKTYIEDENYNSHSLAYDPTKQRDQLKHKVKRALTSLTADAERQKNLQEHYNFEITTTVSKPGSLPLVKAHITVKEDPFPELDYALLNYDDFAKSILTVLVKKIAVFSVDPSRLDPNSSLTLSEKGSTKSYQFKPFPCLDEDRNPSRKLVKLFRQTITDTVIASQEQESKKNMEFAEHYPIVSNYHEQTVSELFFRVPDEKEFMKGNIKESLLDYFMSQLKPFKEKIDLIDFHNREGMPFLIGVEFPKPFQPKVLLQNIKQRILELESDNNTEIVAIYEKERKIKAEGFNSGFTLTREVPSKDNEQMSSLDDQTRTFLDSMSFQYEDQTFVGLDVVLYYYSEEIRSSEAGLEKLTDILIEIGKQHEHFKQLLLTSSGEDNKLVVYFKNATAKKLESGVVIKFGGNTDVMIRAIEAAQKKFLKDGNDNKDKAESLRP